MLSGLRAYVGGEGLWAKGQKDASYYISQYIYTEEQGSYQSFLDSLKVPLGDSAARLELEKSDPVYKIIFQGFVDGGNDPEDIPTMIFLYKYFKNIEYIENAIEQWKVGDSLINELLVVGEGIHYHIINNNMNQEQATQSLLQIEELRNKLNEAEFCSLIICRMLLAGQRIWFYHHAYLFCYWKHSMFHHGSFDISCPY